MADLHDTDYQIQFKRGLAANINAAATKNTAKEAEPHWTTDTDRLHVFDGVQNKACMMEAPDGIPAAIGSAGNPGDMAYDTDYLYICVATDTWRRVALSTW